MNVFWNHKYISAFSLSLSVCVWHVVLNWYKIVCHLPARTEPEYLPYIFFLVINKQIKISPPWLPKRKVSGQKTCNWSWWYRAPNKATLLVSIQSKEEPGACLPRAQRERGHHSTNAGYYESMKAMMLTRRDGSLLAWLETNQGYMIHDTGCNHWTSMIQLSILQLSNLWPNLCKRCISCCSSGVLLRTKSFNITSLTRINPWTKAWNLFQNKIK